MSERCVVRPIRPKAAEAGMPPMAFDGLEASDLARILAFRTEVGLFQAPAPGFWKGVVQRVTHELGIPETTRLGSNLLVL